MGLDGVIGCDIRQDVDGQVRIRGVGQPGDLGWMIMANGELYDAEFGWDASFEALVARIVADFAERSDPGREAGWIAELDGRRVGCVLCVADHDLMGESVARLRILLVDPSVRGRGVGGRLVDACLDFARRAGYARMDLWTNNVLTAARRIYRSRGFVPTSEEPHHSFGHDLIGEQWSRSLHP